MSGILLKNFNSSVNRRWILLEKLSHLIVKYCFFFLVFFSLFFDFLNVGKKLLEKIKKKQSKFWRWIWSRDYPLTSGLRVTNLSIKLVLVTPVRTKKKGKYSWEFYKMRLFYRFLRYWISLLIFGNK